MRNTPLKAFTHKEKSKEEKEQEKRYKELRIDQKIGRTVPTTRENLKQHLWYLRGSKDLFV